ncbi:polysaccharide pyruvyl transferase family protein [Natronomonas salina]|uniref:polysaccharide pyruvyl transferase family protein n=1 Tax=Natronomonas salina TaxID=1710540 RepID=UPI0015B44125|nr:polysaccharide pyruvyl transferase family protein [Natronomonas salina]QLD88772.1 polysaccharide pyruvyl transferase family protein [Natronomonas salina]
MVKIGVLTFHNNENRGAILQAYCLCNLLGDIFDAKAEVIEYRTEAKERARKINLILSKRPLRLPHKYRDRRIVENFIESNIPNSQRSLTTNDHDAAVSWLRDQEYDILVTGSDEIWKIRNRSRNSIGMELKNSLVKRISPTRPFPNLYFLDPSLSATKVAYAASGNTTNLTELSDNQINTLRRHLRTYDAISVRDRHTKQLVEELGFGDVSQVPDPTLMIEIPQKDAATILHQLGIDTKQQILGFHAPDTPLLQEICDIYRDKGYQIVALRSSSFADVELEGVVDPFEYYGMYGLFDMVVTSSLHSTIFSIKHGTPFVTINESEIYRTLESKTFSLLNDFSLLERHIHAVDGDISKFYEKQNYLEEKPDVEHISNRITKLKEKGYEFLEEVKNLHETNNR